MRAVLLDGAAGDDADLAQRDGVVDVGPGQLLVAVLGGGAAHGGSRLEVLWGRTDDGTLSRGANKGSGAAVGEGGRAPEVVMHRLTPLAFLLVLTASVPAAPAPKRPVTK